MAVNDGAASIHGAILRASALDNTGKPASGLAYYQSNILVKYDYNAEIDTGPEIADRNGDGQLAVTFKQMDVMKRLTVSLELILPDPELEVLLTGGVTYVSGSAVVGMQYPSVGVEGVPNGVGLEIWTRAIKNGIQVIDPTTGFPSWFHWVFPRNYLRKSNRTIDVNRMATVFEGFATENPQFGTGPLHDIPYDTSKVAQYYRDSFIPVSSVGALKIT